MVEFGSALRVCDVQDCSPFLDTTDRFFKVHGEEGLVCEFPMYNNATVHTQ